MFINFRKLYKEKKVTQRSHSLVLSLFCISLALQGCSSVKKTLGIDRDPPDEYRVTPTIQPLEMPPDFSCLPIPMPGMERPQDRIARQTQEEKFLGASSPIESSSPGQAALLDMCGVQPNQDKVRYEVDREARMEGKKERPIVETLGLKKAKPKGDAVNPYEEAEELKKKGVSTGSSALRDVVPSSAELPEKPNAL